jgi:transposase
MSEHGAQLTLDGREVDHPVRIGQPLSERQREILRFVRARDVVRTYEVGTMMHAGREGGCARGFPDGQWHLGCCPYAPNDGCDAMNRLLARGLVERVGRGRWRAVGDFDERWVHPRQVPDDIAEQMRQLYVDRGMSTREVAAATFWEQSTVWRTLRRLGVDLRKRHNRSKRLDSEKVLETVELYGRGLSAADVGSILSVSESTVRYRVRMYSRDGVRSHGDAHRLARARDKARASRVAAVERSTDRGAA